MVSPQSQNQCSLAKAFKFGQTFIVKKLGSTIQEKEAISKVVRESF